MDDNQLLQAISQMMDEKIDVLRGEMATQNDELRTLIENNHDDVCKLLKEDYTPIRERVAEFSDYPQVKSQVADHDRALQSQRKEIDELKKKAI